MKPDSISTLPVADRWWAMEDCGEGVVRFWEPHAHELIRANAYLVKGSSRDMLVDAGLGIVSLRRELENCGLLDRDVIAVATHSHFDHVGSLHEFEDRRIHEFEAEVLARGEDPLVLDSSAFPEDFHRSLEPHGMVLPALLIDALPYAEFDPLTAEIRPAAATSTLQGGDRIDLGSRVFEVLHLPGHSPGQIGLWDSASRVLFSADAVYDGALLDEGIPGTDIAAYVRTMRLLRDLPVSRVYAGHESPLDRLQTIEIIDAYLARRDDRTRPPTRTSPEEHEMKAPGTSRRTR